MRLTGFLHDFLSEKLLGALVSTTKMLYHLHVHLYIYNALCMIRLKQYNIL